MNGFSGKTDGADHRLKCPIVTDLPQLIEGFLAKVAPPGPGTGGFAVRRGGLLPFATGVRRAGDANLAVVLRAASMPDPQPLADNYARPEIA